MSRLKVLIISSFAFFVICVLLATFSGSSILLSLFKAFVSTCLVVVFMFGANFFLVKYIPDLFDDKSQNDVTDVSTPGANLDIRINDTTLSSSIGTGGTLSIENDSTLKSDILEANKDVQKDSVEDGSLSSSGFKPVSFSGQEDLSGNDGVVETLPIDNMRETTSEVNKSVKVDDTQLSQTELSQAIEKDVDRLEELPDLQEFVDTSNLKVEETRGEELMNTGTQSFFATDLSEDVSDTNLMAKAVRTVLKREV